MIELMGVAIAVAAALAVAGIVAIIAVEVGR